MKLMSLTAYAELDGIWMNERSERGKKNRRSSKVLIFIPNSNKVLEVSPLSLSAPNNNKKFVIIQYAISARASLPNSVKINKIKLYTKSDFNIGLFARIRSSRHSTFNFPSTIRIAHAVASSQSCFILTFVLTHFLLLYRPLKEVCDMAIATEWARDEKEYVVLKITITIKCKLNTKHDTSESEDLKTVQHTTHSPSLQLVHSAAYSRTRSTFLINTRIK